MDGDLHLIAVRADIGAIDVVAQQRHVGIEPAALDAPAERDIGVDRLGARDRNPAGGRDRYGAGAFARRFE
jgi:hypothetical protein